MRVPHDRSQDPFAGNCPTHGDCWEGLASGPAITERWQAGPEELPDDHGAWLLEADYLALGILSIVMVASPERVIIGGGVMNAAGLAGHGPAQAVRARGGISRYAAARRADRLIPCASAFGDRAGVLGAIALAQAAA